MGGWALGILVIYAALTIGLRALIQRQRTGSYGMNGMRANASAAERCAGVLLALAVVAGVAGCLVDTLHLVGSKPWPTRRVGLTVSLVGIVATFLAQLAMGDSWRIGVNHEERTTLVTGGPYGHVRNPIYTAMLVTTLGVASMVPNGLTCLAFVLMLAGLEVQVRLVEEPYLAQRHGESFRAYTKTVGRFLPGIGRGAR